jgi:4-hydroxy-tetrahydrodipicolinate synthase
MTLEKHINPFEKPNISNGIYAAVLTPMHADLTCDHKKLASHCFELINRGCTGVALFGTTGEGPSFSLLERLEILQSLIDEGLNPRKIILANGSSGIPDTIQLGTTCVKYGCAALLVAPPSFYKNVSDDGVIAFYRKIIQEIDNPNLRIILYHIPQLSGVPISLKIIETLRSEFPETVIGIKESEGNFPFTKSILEKFPDFKVYVGKEKYIIESVHLGGAGAITGLANLYPELICSLYTQGKTTNIPNPALLETIVAALQGIPFIPAAKSLMETRQGEIWHTLRPPLIPMNTSQRASFISALQIVEQHAAYDERQ